MVTTTQVITPLRQRMIDDMRMRKLCDKTQAHYLRAVRQFAKYLGRSPDTASVEDLRNYQLHLVDHGISPASLNAAITGLKFFCDVTLDQPKLMAKMQPVRVPRTLPVVLSREEVARLIAASGNLKHQTALSVAYGAGLGASEVATLIYDLLFDVAAESRLRTALPVANITQFLACSGLKIPAATHPPVSNSSQPLPGATQALPLYANWQPSNPHSWLVSLSPLALFRGFLPRGLYDACPANLVTS
jgi:hypothetical protein